MTRRSLILIAVLALLAVFMATVRGDADSSRPWHPGFDLEVHDARVSPGEEPEYLNFHIDYTNAGAPLVAHCAYGSSYTELLTEGRAWNIDGLTPSGTIPIFGNGWDPQATQIVYECIVTNSFVTVSSGVITLPWPPPAGPTHRDGSAESVRD